MTPKIATAVSNYLSRKGYNTPYINYFEKIQEYLSWYRGDTNWHSYRIWNGKKRVSKKRYSLDMAKTACEDMASLIGVEKIELTFDDPQAEEFVNQVLAENDFRMNAPQLFELMFALGTCSFVGSIEDEATSKEIPIAIDYIHGDMIFPLKWDNGKITECAFATVGGEDDKIAYTVIFYTKNEEGNYVIKKVGLDADGGEVITQGDIDDAEAIETGSNIPQFSICRTNIVNNYDKTSPLGMSVFGNAINVLKSIDETFDGIHNEFKQGKKRIFIKSGLQSVRIEDDASELSRRIYDQIDENDVQFYQVDWTGEHQDKPPIYESNMTLRVNEYQQGMEMLLNMFSKKVGLGENYYTFEKGAVQTTATAVISAKSDLFRNIRKQELAVENALIGLCRTILDLGNRLGHNFDVNQQITVNFDDSIIEDTEKTQQEAMAEYNAGLIDQVEYIAITRRMTREQAVKFIAEMQATDTMKQVESIFNNNFGDI